jgi:Hint domain
VLTASGEAKPIKFIGRRKVSRERAGPWKSGDGPVKISRFAIDGKAPHSDLYITPEHAIYIDAILIPARNLVNGGSTIYSLPRLSSLGMGFAQRRCCH